MIDTASTASSKSVSSARLAGGDGSVAYASERASLRQHGYAVLPKVFEPAVALDLRKELLRIFAEPSPYEGDLNAHADYKRAFFDAFNRYPALRWVPFHPPLLAALRGLLGDDFVWIPEVGIHDSGYGGWHKDTTAQEVAGHRFQWEPDFGVVQVAIYCQENDPLHAGGLDVIPGSHRLPDRIIKFGGGVAQRLAARVRYRLKTMNDDRRRETLHHKLGDVVVFDYRLDHRATQPRVLPIPPHYRKLAIFSVASRNNRHAQAYLDFISSRQDYKYLRDYADTPELLALAEKAGVTMLQPRSAR
jgi:hypothetical protein